jgi:hypothetical protein
MKRIVFASMLIAFFSVNFVPLSTAEMAKEGSASGKAYYSSTWNMLPLGKAYVQINYEARGVSVSDNKADPFHHAGGQCIGAMKIVKGAINEFGLCTYTRPDGDKIFMSYEATGQMGKGVNGTFNFVGGTGKCEGMSGNGEFRRIPLKGPAEGIGASMSTSTYRWKIP